MDYDFLAVVIMLTIFGILAIFEGYFISPALYSTAIPIFGGLGYLAILYFRGEKEYLVDKTDVAQAT
jgi:hypothetical protein